MTNRYYTLYKALKDKCPSHFKGSFGVIDENSENAYGMFIKGGSPTDRNISTGEYLKRRALVTFNVNGGLEGRQGILDGYKFCEDVVSSLERVFNYLYTDPDTDGKIMIIGIDIFGDVNDLGVNHFNMPIYSINIGVDYKEVN